MKTTITTVGTLFLALTFAFTSCKKSDDAVPEEETPVQTPAPAAPAPVTNTPSDADGVCIAVNVNVTMTVGGFTVPIDLGSANANFYTAAGSTSLATAGTVKANDSTLTNSSNSYIFTPKSATGINFISSNKSRWSITGNGSIPAITYTATGFPSTPSVPSVSSISKGGSYTINSSSVSNADSLCYQITAGSVSIYKIVAATQTSHTFSAAEMGTLEVTENGFITVTGYKFNNTTVSSKKIYFININTSNKSVKVTN